MVIDRVSNGTIWLSGDGELKPEGRILEKKLPDSLLFVVKTNIEGIYTYGSEQLREEYYGHKKGYIWASRASVMNAAFETTLYEAAYRKGNSCYRTCAVDLVRFEQLLKEAGYSVDFTPQRSADSIDVDFEVKKVEEK